MWSRKKSASLSLLVLASTMFVSSAAHAFFTVNANSACTDGGPITCGADGVQFDTSGGNVTFTVDEATLAADTGVSAQVFVGGNNSVLNFTAPSVNVVGTLSAGGGGGNITQVIIGPNSNVNMNDNWAANSTNIDPAGTLTVNANNLTYNGTLVQRGTLNLGTNTFNVNGGDFNFATSTLGVTVTSGGAGVGNLADAGAATFSNGATIQVTLPGDPIPDGTVLTVVATTGGVGGMPTVSGGNSIYSLALVPNGNNLDLLITRNGFGTGSLTSGPNAYLSGVGTTIDGLANTGTPDPSMALLIQNLESLPNNQEITKALSTLVPISDSSLMVVSQNNVGRALYAAQERFDKRRHHMTQTTTTTSSGDMGQPMGAWVQFFGSDINQKHRDGIEGYDAWNTGFALGVDTVVMDEWVVGAGFSYAYSDVDSKAFHDNHLDVNTYQGFLYGSWNSCYPIYLDALVSVAFHDYNSARNIIVPPTPGNAGIRARAEGDYDAWQYGFWTEAGYEWLYHNWVIVPHINYQYSNLNVDEYRETGAGSYNLTINYDDMSESVLGGGLRIGYLADTAPDVSVMPYVYGQVYHDFTNDRQQSVSNFAGGGAAFVTPGIKPDDTSFRVGAGLDVASTNQWFLTVNYDYHFKDDYHAHGGFLKFRYEWA